MIFEIREYAAAPGRIDRLRRRFVDQTVPLLHEHGVDVVALWTDPSDHDALLYLTRFTDETHRTKAWDAFQGDSRWQAIKKATETDGPLISSMTVRILESLEGPSEAVLTPGLGVTR